MPSFMPVGITSDAEPARCLYECLQLHLRAKTGLLLNSFEVKVNTFEELQQLFANTLVEFVWFWMPEGSAICLSGGLALPGV